MISCNLRTLFDSNSEEHITSISDNIYSSLGDVEENPLMSASDFVNTLIGEMENYAPFYLKHKYNVKDVKSIVEIRNSYKSLIEKIQESINIIHDDFLREAESNPEDVKLYIHNIMNKEWVASVNDYINNNFLKDVYVDDIVNERNEQDVFDDITSKKTLGSSINDNLMESLNDLLSSNIGVSSFLQRSFGDSLFTALVWDKETGEKTTTDIRLNRNILHYKETLFNVISEFLKVKNAKMYSSDGSVSSAYYDVMNKMKDLITKEQEDKAAYRSKINGGFESLLSNKKGFPHNFIGAVSAYATLVNFDSLVEELVGNSISFDKGLKNIEVNVNRYKYSFAKDSSHQRTSWTDSENRTSIDNTSKMSKLVIERIPLYVNGVYQNRNISLVQLNDTMAKLFSNTSKITAWNDENTALLIKYLESFHTNTFNSLYNIFKLISDEYSSNGGMMQSELRDSSGTNFNDIDFGVIDSFYRYVFKLDGGFNGMNFEKSSVKSLNEAELKETIFGDISINRFSIVQDLVNVINDSVDASYMQVSQNDDGTSEIGLRKKYNNRREHHKYIDNVNYSVINMSKEDRVKWSNEAKVENITHQKFLNKITVFGDIPIYAFINQNIRKLADTRVTFFKDSDGTEVDNTVEEVFGVDGIDFNDQSISKYLLSGKESFLSGFDRDTTKKIIFARNFLKFIDDRIKTDFLSKDGLIRLNVLKQINVSGTSRPKNNYMNDYFIYAAKAQYVSDQYLRYDSLKEENPKLTINEFILKDAFNNTDRRDYNTYFYNNDGVFSMRSIPAAAKWVEEYIDVISIVTGESVKSVSKNQDNDNEANYSSSFLGAQHNNVLHQISESPESSVMRNNTLFKYKGAIQKAVINSDIKRKDGKVQKIATANKQTLYFNAIVNNFFGRYLNGDETVTIQATTYSDKSKIVNHEINLQSIFRKKFSDISINEIIDKFKESIPVMHQQIRENIVEDYNNMFGTSDVIEISNKIKNMSEEDLVQLAESKGVSLVLDLHYRNTNNGLVLNESVFSKKLMDVDRLLESQKQMFINDLRNSGLKFYIASRKDIENMKSKYTNSEYEMNMSLYRNSHSIIAKSISKFIDGIELPRYMRKWVKNGELVINDGPELNPLLERFFYTDSLLSGNLRTIFTGFEFNHPDKSKYKNMYANVLNNQHIVIQDNSVLSAENFKILSKNKGNIFTKINGIESNGYTKWSDVMAEAEAAFFNDNIIVDRDSFLDGYTNFLLSGKTLESDNSKIYNDFDRIVEEKWLSVNGSKIIASDDYMKVKFSDKFDIEIGKTVDTQSIPTAKFMTASMGAEVNAMLNELPLVEMLYSGNHTLEKIAEGLTEIVDNIAQGTQLKRNVPIPATMHYMFNNSLYGIKRNIKVAVVMDLLAPCFNYKGDIENIAALDGSAYISSIQSILENKALGSQEVGGDKKPLWHGYNQRYGTAELMKFASFEVNNERMRMSLNSDLSLLNIHKKMTNLRWNGSIDISKSSGHSIIFEKDNELYDLDFKKEILGDNRLFYYTYENGAKVYNEIVGFGKNEDGNYYTEERYVNESGNVINNETHKKIQMFNISGEYSNGEDVTHTIDSLYELWQAMGGMSSVDLVDGSFVDGESSHYALAGFMNAVLRYKEGADRYDETQNTYDQPLKDYYIGYVANNTALKNGATNINQSDSWLNDKPLHTFTMDTSFLGVQLDADHDVEMGATMKEFSQVISALVSGGNVHESTRLIYSLLEEVARDSSKVELDAINEYMNATNLSHKDAKSRLYDIVAKSILNNVSMREDIRNLTSNILNDIEKDINSNFNHENDEKKIPFSDSNVYSSLISTLTSIINKKSIKRTFPGSGMVMVPSYGSMQYFEFDGRKYMFQDVLKKALESGVNVEFTGNTQAYEKEVVRKYLEDVQSKQNEIRRDQFDLFDVVHVKVENSVTSETETYKIRLNDIDTFYKFKDGNLSALGISIPEGSLVNFYIDVTQPRNLKPTIISFDAKASDGSIKHMSVFEIPAIRENFENKSLSETAKFDRAQSVFKNLHNGFFRDGDSVIQVMNLKSEEAEQISSNMYSNMFDNKRKSVAEMLEEGADAFRVDYEQPYTEQADMTFISASGKDVYISFGFDDNFKRREFKASNRSVVKEGNDYNAYYIDSLNNKRYLIGKYKEISEDEYNELLEKNKKNVMKSGNKYYHFFQFVHKGITIEPDITYKSNYGNVVKKFIIDKRAVEKFYKDSKVDPNSIITDILDQIYNDDSYLGVGVLPSMTNNQAWNIYKYLSNMKSISSEFRSIVLSDKLKRLKADLDKGENVLTLDLSKNYNDFFENIAKSRFSSWYMSLYYTAARIPSQDLQSFMRMKTIAYTGNSKNKVYVSHFQAFLQGSDYDIDKANLMGFSIGNDGIIIKFSNLFDTSSPELLKASMGLPVPRNLKFVVNETDNSGNLYGININESLNTIHNTNNSVKKMYLYKKLITDIYNQIDRIDPSLKSIPIIVNDKFADEFEKLKIHEGTILNEKTRLDAYKNAISSSIQNTIQDIRNTNLSHTNITMDNLKKPIRSENKVAYMNMFNPLTKLNMQSENMIAKKVIGITAVGEKVYFTLTNYFNDGMFIGDEEWLDNLRFNKSFDRIEGRYSGNITKVTKKTLANTNFSINPEVLKYYSSQIEESGELTDEIMEDLSEWVANNIDNLNGLNDSEIKEYYKSNKNMAASLMISELLSAATDNAKELILAKINGSPDLIKNHLYLLMIGFDIKDIISFMTSPAINTINNLMLSNFLDEYQSDIRVEDAVNMALGNIDINRFFSEKEFDIDERRYIEKSASILGSIASGLKKLNVKFDGNPLGAYINGVVNYKIGLSDVELPPLSEMYKIKNSIMMSKFGILSGYVDNIIREITRAKFEYINNGMDPADYEKDIEEFVNVNELANETTTLGGVFLKMNQGIPSDYDDITSKLRQITDSVKKREKIFGMRSVSFIGNNKKLGELVERLANYNGKSEDQVKEVLELAHAFGIINNFNVDNWLNNKKLYYSDIVKNPANGENIKFYGKELSIPEDIEISYRDLVAKYYNIIKGTWNIFDVMNRVPQYRAIVDLLAYSHNSFKSLSVKYRLSKSIYDELMADSNYIDDKQVKIIRSYIDDVLISNFFDNEGFNYPISRGTEIINNMYENSKVNSNTTLNLSTAHGRAAFKKVFENQMLNLKTNGWIMNGNGEKVEVPDFKNNEFLSGLRIVLDSNGIPRLAMDMDLLTADSSPYKQAKLQGYINGLADLKSVKLSESGMTLADWVVLYNLYVNKNQWGSERFTALFRGEMMDNPVFQKYFDYISSLDYNLDGDDALKQFSYNLDDLYIRMAPYTTKYDELEASAPVIKTRDKNGKMVYKRKIRAGRSFKYVPFSIFPGDELVGNNSTFATDEQMANYRNYQMMPMKNNDLNTSLRAGLLDENVENVAKSIQSYVRRGILTINIEC